jgi:hypothetical protein
MRVPFGAHKAGGTMDWTIADDPVRAFAEPPFVDDAAAAGLSPGQLGAAYFIPTAIVPVLLITHGLMFRVLLQSQRGRAVAASGLPVSKEG